MPLHARFDINGDDIGELTVEYTDTATEREYFYKYYYKGVKGTASGSVWHNPDDGAMTLMSKVFNKIDFPNWRLV